MLSVNTYSQSRTYLQKSVAKTINAILKNIYNNSKQANSNSSFITKYLKINYTRSKLLISLLKQEHNNISSDFIVNYCVVIELLHIASQIHSVIESPVAINSKKLSIEQIILIGDLLFTVAFEQMLKFEQDEILTHFAETTQAMSLHEATLAEYSGNNSDTLLELIRFKYWPLFKSILFFYEITNTQTNNSNQHDLEVYIKERHTQYIINKINNNSLFIPVKYRNNLTELLKSSTPLHE